MASPNEPTSITVVESPSSVIITSGAQGPRGPVGTAIYSGEGAPGSGIGALGDFYLDTTNHYLYGPKSAGDTLGPDESFADPFPTPDTVASGSKELASWFNVTRAGVITSARVYASSDSGNSARTVNLWAYPGTTLLATMDIDTGSNDGLMTFDFPTPIPVTAGSYKISYGFDDLPNFEASTTSSFTPSTSLSFNVATYSDTIGAAPNSIAGGIFYFIDVVFNATSEVWPLALVSATFP